MKKSLLKTIIPTLVLVILFSLGGCTSNSESEVQTEDLDEIVATEPEVESATVTTYQISKSDSFFMSLLGTVEADSHVRVFPGTAGQVVSVNAKEGDAVNKGDVLFVLGGSNGVQHPNIIQYKIAKANYEAAASAYGSSVKSANAAVKSAELQLQSTQHQSEGSYIDYQAFAESIGALRDSIGLTRTTLNETKMQNQRNLESLTDGVGDLEDAIDDLEDEKREAVLDLEEQIVNTFFDEEAKRALEALLKTTKDTFNNQIDALEKEIDGLLDQYNAVRSGGIITENQIMAQLQQAESQQKSLYMTRDSTKKKLGLENGTSDPVLIAEQGVNMSKAQSEIALTQAKSQLNMARINLDSAFDLQKQLLIQAPTSGTIGSINVSEGDSISPQTSLTEIFSEGDYVLKVSIDIDSASKIDLNKNAEVLIGGRYIKAPITNVSSVADQMSRLVPVTVKLPKIKFRANQTLNVKLPIRSSNVGSSTGSVLLIPLDAVIIGTEEQFVYVAERGKAKKVTVKLGEIHGDVIEILNGLDSDDDVIVDGVKDLTDGQSVNIK